VLAAAVAAAGFGTHRPFAPRGFLIEIAAMVGLAAIFGALPLVTARGGLRIAGLAALVLLSTSRGCAGCMVHTLSEPTLHQMNEGGWLAWLVYPLLLAVSCSGLLTGARSMDASAPIDRRWSLDLRAAALMASVGAGSLLALSSLHAAVKLPATALAVLAIALGAALATTRVLAARRVARQLQLAGESAQGFTLRAPRPGEEHLPRLRDGGADRVLAHAAPRPAGGPFREAMEDVGLVRVEARPGSPSLLQVEPRWAAIAGAWLLLGFIHAVTYLSPDKPPYAVATRFRHLQIERVDEPALQLPDVTFWQAPSGVVGYRAAEDRVIDDADDLLARFAPGTVEDVARRSALLRHGCRLVAPPAPTRSGDAIRYECRRSSWGNPGGPPPETHEDPIAPQALR
jgi:hypothetical protein